jgi:hypothetical protein
LSGRNAVVAPRLYLTGLHLRRHVGIDTSEQHLAGDTLVQDATGVRRLPGNQLDAPPASSRRGPKPSPARSSRARFPERPRTIRPVVSHVAGLTWMWPVMAFESRNRRWSGWSS